MLVPSNTALIIAAGALLAGVVLLLWGRSTGGFFLMVGAAAAGLALSNLVIPQTKVNPIVVRLACAVVPSFVAFLLSRLMWAAITAGIAGTVAVTIVILNIQGALPDLLGQIQHADNGWQIDADGLVRLASKAVSDCWPAHATPLVSAAAAATLGPLMLGLIFAKTTKVFITALLGAAGIVGGGVSLGLTIKPSLGVVLAGWWYVPLALAGALFVAGAAFQGHRHAVAARADKAEKEAREESEKHKKENGRSADD